ncbi:hypothetical protein SKAU_G00175910 [Synaphobranchus kaupii]|uniref:Uncharacterized protein n=1 Tax=Synaphobranchus kaupii TaxID=118154 RepID=A0A9Q1J098_SYNKA|nr:hypothetical protein SKAU_G00175910 [Synaphobranchus kaupii]
MEIRLKADFKSVSGAAGRDGALGSLGNPAALAPGTACSTTSLSPPVLSNTQIPEMTLLDTMAESAVVPKAATGTG